MQVSSPLSHPGLCSGAGQAVPGQEARLALLWGNLGQVQTVAEFPATYHLVEEAWVPPHPAPRMGHGPCSRIQLVFIPSSSTVPGHVLLPQFPLS